MEKLLVLIDRSALLLVAPPAWGKTSLLLDLFASGRKFVFLSPLRALANEFYLRTSQKYRCVNIKKKKEFSQVFGKEKIIITTPEVFDFNCNFINTDYIFIYDEFHLFYYWGDTFRPSLESLYQFLSSDKVSSLFLTATMSNDFFNRWKMEMSLNYKTYYFMNLGNQKFKNKPYHLYFFPFFLKEKMIDLILAKMFLKRREETFLVFCRYRNEVDFLIKFFAKSGFKGIGCKGGEVAYFQSELEKNPSPDIIISTSVLGHGVNLPSLKRVFLLYPVKNRDFWLQMATRGGRKGEKYSLYSMDFQPECGSYLICVIKTLFVTYYHLLLGKIVEYRRYFNSKA